MNGYFRWDKPKNTSVIKRGKSTFEVQIQRKKPQRIGMNSPRRTRCLAERQHAKIQLNRVGKSASTLNARAFIYT